MMKKRKKHSSSTSSVKSEMMYSSLKRLYRLLDVDLHSYLNSLIHAGDEHNTRSKKRRRKNLSCQNYDYRASPDNVWIVRDKHLVPRQEFATIDDGILISTKQRTFNSHSSVQVDKPTESISDSWISLKGNTHMYNIFEKASGDNRSEWYEPSKRTLEKFVLRHEIGDFILKPNSLCYYKIVPKRNPDTPCKHWWDFYNVWPIYHFAHQKRLASRDQQLFVDVFGRFCKRICRINYFYGITQSVTLHRMKHLDQLLSKNKSLPFEVAMCRKQKKAHPLVRALQSSKTRHLTGRTIKNEPILFDIPMSVAIPMSPVPINIPCLTYE